MSTVAAPPPKKTNRIGLEVLNYKGGKTTLCAGCGHNAISERIVECFYDLGIEPTNVAKFSGIGCSSKSPAYFLGLSHGFNSVHGRMPSIATGALLANRNLLGLGVTGDGDTASIGLGQFMHTVRRNMPMIYIIEDNGVYGLTKGNFPPPPTWAPRSRPACTTICRPSIAAPWLCDGAQPSWRVLSAATRSSCKPFSKPPSRTAASPSSTSFRPVSPSTTTRVPPRATAM